MSSVMSLPNLRLEAAAGAAVRGPAAADRANAQDTKKTEVLCLSYAFVLCLSFFLILSVKAIEVKIQTHPHFEGLPLPEYQTHGASGFDLLAACQEPLVLASGERALIPTGISISLPLGTEAQVRPRSGLADRHGVTLLNTPGTIDSDYRGEIKVILINLGQEPFTVTRGMRIAQVVVAEVIKARLSVADNLDATLRGSGGFGHTGTH